MGCNESKDKNLPTLLCEFEINNEEQKKYCLDLRDRFNHDKIIRFEIKSMDGTNFSVKFKIKGKIYDIQNIFENSEEAKNNALQQMYDLLDGKRK